STLLIQHFAVYLTVPQLLYFLSLGTSMYLSATAPALLYFGTSMYLSPTAPALLYFGTSMYLSLRSAFGCANILSCIFIPFYFLSAAATNVLWRAIHAHLMSVAGG